MITLKNIVPKIFQHFVGKIRFRDFFGFICFRNFFSFVSFRFNLDKKKPKLFVFRIGKRKFRIRNLFIYLVTENSPFYICLPYFQVILIFLGFFHIFIFDIVRNVFHFPSAMKSIVQHKNILVACVHCCKN